MCIRDRIKTLPLTDPDTQKKLWEDSLALWQGVLGQYGIGPVSYTHLTLPTSDLV